VVWGSDIYLELDTSNDTTSTASQQVFLNLIARFKAILTSCCSEQNTMSFDLQLDLTQLTNLVIQLERDDIQTADALLVRITGDYIGSRMLARLLYWFPRSVKQGWVYKSWRDWGAEVGISPAQIKRVHQQGILEQVGIQRRLMKAHGAPTTHYRLDMR
jgi:hypothetical protein